MFDGVWIKNWGSSGMDEKSNLGEQTSSNGCQWFWLYYLGNATQEEVFFSTTIIKIYAH